MFKKIKLGRRNIFDNSICLFVFIKLETECFFPKRQVDNKTRRHWQQSPSQAEAQNQEKIVEREIFGSFIIKGARCLFFRSLKTFVKPQEEKLFAPKT